MVSIGQWIQEYLHNHKISAKQFSDIVDCDPSFISHLRDGSRRLSPDSVIEWNERLELSEDERIGLMEASRILLPNYHPVRKGDLETIDLTARNLQLMGRTMENITAQAVNTWRTGNEIIKVGY